MAIYKVSCGHCGDNNTHEASSDEQSLEKHTASTSHIENKAKYIEDTARFEKRLSDFTHGKDHN
jgi:hypothetical protein